MLITPSGIFKDTVQISLVSLQILFIQYDFSPHFPHRGIDCHHLPIGRLVVNIFTELWLYLEHNKDQLDAANAKNVQLEAELNQVNGKLNAVSQSLAMALARPASSNLLGGAQAPKLSKIFADPGTYDGSRGKKFEEWWTHICVWQDKNSTTLAGAAGICAILSRMVGRDASTFACARLNEMIGGQKWTWQEFTTLVKGNFRSSNEKD